MTLEKIREQIKTNEAAKARYRENSSQWKSIERVLVTLRSKEADAVKKAAEDAAKKAAEDAAKVAAEKDYFDKLAKAITDKAAADAAKKITNPFIGFPSSRPDASGLTTKLPSGKTLIYGGGALLLGWLIFKVMK